MRSLPDLLRLRDLMIIIARHRPSLRICSVYPVSYGRALTSALYGDTRFTRGTESVEGAQRVSVESGLFESGGVG